MGQIRQKLFLLSQPSKTAKFPRLPLMSRPLVFPQYKERLMTKKRVRITDENDPLNSTEQVLAGFEQVSKITCQQDKKLESQEDNKSTSQLPNKSTSQPVNKPKLRKSTFQISEGVLDRLEQLHLRLQLELGKKDAPYKEVIVEEAIVQLLDQMNSNPTELLEALSKRQEEREN